MFQTKDKKKKIYSFEKVSGSSILIKIHLIIILVTGYGDVTFNPRRSILGAISIGGEAAYHLYDFATGKADIIAKFIRKSRWHSQYSTEEGI